MRILECLMIEPVTMTRITEAGEWCAFFETMDSPRQDASASDEYE